MKTFCSFWFLFPIFILVTNTVNAGVQAVFYVSPTGSGSTFSQAQPGNLFAARDQIRTMSTSMTGDLVVYLYGGIYQLTNSFQLQENTTNHDSGTGGYNIIYQAYPGSLPILSGGMIVTNWSLFDAATNIWRAYVGTNVSSRQLYVNGVRAIRARGEVPSIYENGSIGFTLNSAGSGFFTTNLAMQSWGNITNVELVDRADWKQMRCPVAAINGTNVTMQAPGWTYMANPPTPGIPWAGSGPSFLAKFALVSWVENAYELMASPGMWYLNQTTGYLYYIPRPGENLTNAVVAMPVVEKLIDASGGSLTTPIHNLVFSGITFEYATWLLPSSSSGYADNQAAIMWSGPTNALKTLGNVSFQTSRNIQLTNNVFVHLGGSAIDFGGGAHANMVIGNHIEDISSCGITLGEVTDFATTDTNQMTDGNVIQDNYIRKIGADYEDAVGIWTGYVRNTLITHNDIANTPYSGMSVGWGWGAYSYAENNQITDNYVGQVMQTLIDGGSLYTLSAQTNSWATGNYFQHSSWNGFYFDEGSAYYSAVSNVVDDCQWSWASIWTNIDHDISVTNNFSNVAASLNNGTDCVIANNITNVTGQNWPPAALAIIQNAGLEPDYQTISLSSQTLNDNATNCNYSGSWNYIANSSAGDYDGDVHVSTSVGDSVDFSFYGTGVSAVCEKSGSAGTADVYLDGVYQTTVNCQSTNLQPQQVIFAAGNLSAQMHDLRLVNHNGQNLAVDAFIVQGISEIIINDDALTYDTNWVDSILRGFGDYNSDVHFTQTNGASVQYTFTGPDIAWLGELNNDEGNVDVYLDGVQQTSVNCFSTTRIAQQKLFSATNLSAGQHTIKLVKDSGTYMIVDALIVTAPASVPTLNVLPVSNGLFSFSFSGKTGVNYVIEASANLFDWVPVLTNASPTNPIIYTASLTNQAGFYRVRQ